VIISAKPCHSLEAESVKISLRHFNTFDIGDYSLEREKKRIYLNTHKGLTGLGYL
jgi:hypothetical protein